MPEGYMCESSCPEREECSSKCNGYCKSDNKQRTHTSTDNFLSVLIVTTSITMIDNVDEGHNRRDGEIGIHPYAFTYVCVHFSHAAFILWP